MFYDKFAMIYKAYDYKLVYVFSTCGRPEYFLWLSVFEMDSSSGFLFFCKISFILYLHTIFVAIWTIFRCNTFAIEIK